MSLRYENNPRRVVPWGNLFGWEMVHNPVEQFVPHAARIIDSSLVLSPEITVNGIRVDASIVSTLTWNGNSFINSSSTNLSQDTTVNTAAFKQGNRVGYGIRSGTNGLLIFNENVVGLNLFPPTVADVNLLIRNPSDISVNSPISMALVGGENVLVGAGGLHLLGNGTPNGGAVDVDPNTQYTVSCSVVKGTNVRIKAIYYNNAFNIIGESVWSDSTDVTALDPNYSLYKTFTTPPNTTKVSVVIQGDGEWYLNKFQFNQGVFVPYETSVFKEYLVDTWKEFDYIRFSPLIEFTDGTSFTGTIKLKASQNGVTMAEGTGIMIVNLRNLNMRVRHLTVEVEISTVGVTPVKDVRFRSLRLQGLRE